MASKRKLPRVRKLGNTDTSAAAPKVCLVQGKARSWLPDSGKYRFCLSANQQRTLFKGKAAPKLIGCDTFACAYEAADEGRVIKLTTDASDVGALAQMESTDASVAPRMFAAYELIETGARFLSAKKFRRPKIYAVEVERLQPLPSALKRPFACATGTIQSRRALTPDVVTATATQCCKVGSAARKADCAERLGDFLQGVRQIADDVGLRPTDLHAGNVGVDAKGRLKILDFGLSAGVEGAYMFPARLDGARARKLSRKRR